MNILSKNNVQDNEQLKQINLEIVQILIQWRKVNNITEVEMSNNLDISRNTLRKFEKCDKFDFKLLLKYCKIANISVGIVVEY